MLDRQKLFDDVLEGLRNQGCRSAQNGVCRYRLIKEARLLKCGIGHLIPNDEYSDEMEGGAAYAPLIITAVTSTRKYGKLEPGGREDIKFIGRLQRALHDDLPDARFEYELETAAILFAGAFGLRYTPRDNKQKGESHA